MNKYGGVTFDEIKSAIKRINERIGGNMNKRIKKKKLRDEAVKLVESLKCGDGFFFYDGQIVKFCENGFSVKSGFYSSPSIEIDGTLIGVYKSKLADSKKG